MKGSVDIWVWIVGGIIAGFLIFIIAYSQLLQTSKLTAEQESIEQYKVLSDRINKLCWSMSGNKEGYSISVNENIRGIYLTEDKYLKMNNTELVNKILNEEVSSGNFLCIKVEGRRISCKELDCKAEIPYLGAVPTEFSLSALIDEIKGNYKKFRYDLELARESNIVKIIRKYE